MLEMYHRECVVLMWLINGNAAHFYIDIIMELILHIFLHQISDE